MQNALSYLAMFAAVAVCGIFIVLIYGSIFVWVRRNMGFGSRTARHEKLYDLLQRDLFETAPIRSVGRFLRQLFEPLLGLVKFFAFIFTGVLKVIAYPLRGLGSLLLSLGKVALPFLGFWALISAIRWAWNNPLF